MSIAINGSGTLSGITVGGLPDGIVDTDTLAANAVTNGKLASGVGGKILKVHSVQSSTGQDITSSSYTDITGLTITLTPAATSKCLVHAVVTGYGEFLSTFHGHNKMQVLRDSTTIGVVLRNIRLQTNSSTDYLQVGCPLTQTVLDTHGANGSTAITYKCQGLTNHGHMFVNSSYGTYSSLTVYEVAPNS
tara:strand:+ start:7419 stop:7988 length:570 start_codon:yes stop_codon:yes gene_type:complete